MSRQRRPRLSPVPSPALRIGPRPLPLHLLTHLATLFGSLSALPLWKNGSLSWKPHLAEQANALKASLDAAGPETLAQFETALVAEAVRRHAAFLTGIEAYRRHPYRRDLLPPPVVWHRGSTRLLDYRADVGVNGGVPVLVIPSLVNRAYILDLSERYSLMRYFSARGLAPFLVDWDAPGLEEQGFTLTDYVLNRLEPMVDRVAEMCGRPPVLVGYCMGGLLALPLAQRRRDSVAALVLLATPFDFAAGRAETAQLLRILEPSLGAVIGAAGCLPVDLLQALFASLDPGLAARKFSAFALLKANSARARDFVALEDWANDGVPLAAAVARECLFGWYGANAPARGDWLIDGRPVRPEEVTVPTLAIVPGRDRIVPPDSALPLAGRIAGARVRMVAGGHVGLLTGPRTRTDVLSPLVRWIRRYP
ncbi:alpha/beta fold hydrolase [Magnetospirillum molischianum]|uniref:Poly-beta-hydroxybutyrate polymerase n=1 Tax=Magnetospirillum molischianum DSM 120 TaxID=1150626 RepID=H8FWY6_MAGML|nr:alpha/beta fold hydrolase [Magnetospirillum molischianum]CCG42874.1 Poly-beta-hydroxybutyrate polymerase [Magnetospirillum molischianum DSM 120]